MSNREPIESVTAASETAPSPRASRPAAAPIRSCPIGNGGWSRAGRGERAEASGRAAERLAEAALLRDGWAIVARRVRTAAGEVDLVAERDGLVAFVEVKYRPTLSDAVAALTARQQARLTGAAAILLGENPGWGRAGVRFDVLAVDAAGRVRRIRDAFRPE